MADSLRSSSKVTFRVLTMSVRGATPSRRTKSPGKDHGAASIAAGSQVRQKIPLWPEWSDADINNEKWEAAHGKGKEKDKGKSPVVQHFFDDPEGKIELPQSLKVDTWKRPTDFIFDQQPVVVDPDKGLNGFDLLSANEHLHDSELIRWIISEVTALWRMHAVKNPPPEDPSDETYQEYTYNWKPWEHIFAINKVTKGPYIPAHNPYGKYAVKLYWMGSWRKIFVDDLFPFDEYDRLLLPATSIQYELWPMLLTKALIKVTSLDYGSTSSEFGDTSIIQCLTGWLPETIPLQYGHVDQIWKLLKAVLPEWVLPEPEPEKIPEVEAPPDTAGQESINPEKATEKSEIDKKSEKADPKAAGKEKDAGKEKAKEGKEKGKDAKDDKKGKDKDKAAQPKEKPDEVPIPESPELVVFASYVSSPKYPPKVSVLREMADASERLRQSGLSHLFPHPVWITQTRSCPLEPPPPPEKIPAWKLIRPKKKKTTPLDEPKAEPEAPKPIQCVEITSPFVNYKVSPVPIPTDVHRPKSSLERGATRPPTSNVDAIEETDENIPEPEPVEAAAAPPPETPKPEDLPRVEPAVETASLASKPSGSKPGTPSGKKKKEVGSAAKKEEASPKPEPKKGLGSPGKERKKSSTVRDRTDSIKSKDSKMEKDPKSAASLPRGADTTPSVVFDPNAPHAEGEEEQATEQTPEPPKPTNLWMDFETFVKCFKTIYIYHKPNTYACNHKFSDLKSVAPASSTKGGTKAAPTAAVTPVYDDRAPHYMFVDNLKPSEIVVSFSSLSRWHDAPLEPKESKTSVKGGKGDKGGDDGASVLDGSTHKEPTQPTPAQPGLLVAEPYSWKSLVTGQPILRLKTTATKAAVLTLPPGRHVLRFMLTAPLGYHIHLSSSVQFVYGDEETVMEKLTAESCRFVDNAVQTMQLIGKCINNLSDPLAFHQSYEELSNCHCPYRSVKTISKVNHFKLFNESLYSILRKTLPAELLTPEMAFAWRTFNFDATTKNILGLTTGSRPGTSATSHRGSAKEKSKKQKEVQVEKNTPSEVDKQTPENWLNREPTPEEHVATIKLQKGWRGCYVRKIRNARMSGTEDHQKVLEQLQKAWTILEPNMEQHGLNLFRAMFKADPDLMEKYPFHKDEWNKISYADYQGSFPDQPAGTWFVVFREVFYVTEEMLVVPKMYCTIPNCLLRVVNNDTREEIPRVFQKVAPFVYKRNRRGYTFIAESRTTDQPLPNGKWRMRLIGSLTALPAPARNEVNCSFHTREIRDYYIPNEKCIIFRYTVKVTEEHVASLQMSTSKPDVYIKLMVLDHEEEVLSTVGKGHAVLPSFIFLKDPGSDQSVSEEKEDMKRANSRASNKGGGKAHAAASKEKDAGKRQGSAMSRAGSRTSSRHSDLPPLDPEEEEKENRPHKYIIQAMVMRNSWPLSESSWTFVQMLKDMEKNELKVANKEERPPSAPKNDKAQGKAAQGKGSKGKDKDKGAKDKQGSRPPSQQFDTTKPYWTLRIVSDGTAAEEIDVKKDTERADEIRAMKKAWEEAEPGRAAKALQSRLQYLSTHMIKLQPEAEEGAEKGDSAAAAAAPPQEGAEQILAAAAAEMGPPQTPTSEPPDTEEILTLEPPPPPTPKEMLQPLDLTPYLRKSGDGPRYLDEAEIQRQMDAKRKEIEEYKAFREQVEQWREEDRQLRNQLKIKQLEECQALQAALDKKRNEINIPREAFRQKYLEAERKRLEELAAQEAALRAEQEKAPSPKGRKSAKGKKSPAGKKKK